MLRGRTGHLLANRAASAAITGVKVRYLCKLENWSVDDGVVRLVPGARVVGEAGAVGEEVVGVLIGGAEPDHRLGECNGSEHGLSRSDATRGVAATSRTEWQW